MDCNWIEIRVNSDPIVIEEIAEFLNDLEHEGIEVKELCFKIFFNEKKWDSQKKENLIKILEKVDINRKQIDYSVIENQNWNENWKENFKTFRLGKNIVIQPDWENNQPKNNEKIITIAPKMAFGTGHHETTQLILKSIEDEIKPGDTVLDAGTGSGILAIYAALLNAGKVVAFDFDPEAVVNAKENCQLNNVSQKIELLCSDINGIQQQLFDTIIANINKNVLLLMAKTFRLYAHSTTKLFLSGLLDTDEKEVKQVYKSAGWVLKNKKQLNEWISLEFVYSE